MVATGQEKVREKINFSRSRKSQGILKSVSCGKYDFVLLSADRICGGDVSYQMSGPTVVPSSILEEK